MTIFMQSFANDPHFAIEIKCLDDYLEKMFPQYYMYSDEYNNLYIVIYFLCTNHYHTNYLCIIF